MYCSLAEDNGLWSIQLKGRWAICSRTSKSLIDTKTSNNATGGNWLYDSITSENTENIPLFYIKIFLCRCDACAKILIQLIISRRICKVVCRVVKQFILSLARLILVFNIRLRLIFSFLLVPGLSKSYIGNKQINGGHWAERSTMANVQFIFIARKFEVEDIRTISSKCWH